MPNFSVIIPAYNRADLLPRTIESVIAQKFNDYEIVVADDGSTDATPSVLEGLSRKLGPKLIVARQENRGEGAARNLAIRHATGDYLAFLDSDDLWFPWTLQTYAWAIAEHRTPSVLMGSGVEFFYEAELSGIHTEQPKTRWFADYFAAARVPPFWCCSGGTVVRAEVARSGNGFLGRNVNAEDQDFLLRIGAAPGFVQVMTPTLFGYRRHAASAIASVYKTYRGCCEVIEAERAGRYPGGRQRARERRTLIGRVVRPVAVQCARDGSTLRSLDLYRRTFRWNLSGGRAKFLLALPPVTLFGLGKSILARKSVAKSK